MTRTNRWILGLTLALPLANGVAMAADGDEKLEFPPLVPDEVITGEVTVDAAAPSGQAATVPAATAPVAAPVTAAPAAPAQAAAAPAPVQQQGYYSGYQGYPGYQNYQNYQGYQGYYPGYSAYPGYGYGYPYGYPYGYGQQGYGYGAPAQPYYGYRRPSRNSGSSWPWMGGTWTEGPWNNGKFTRGDWLGGGPSRWFKGGDFQDGFAEMWDDMINAPAEMGTMPGGWEFPTVSTPNPVDVGEELGRSAPEFVREVPNMIDIN